jgi:hypothetical protein
MLLPKHFYFIDPCLIACVFYCVKNKNIFDRNLKFFYILVCTCVIHKRCKASVVTTCPGIRTCFEV